MLRNFAENLSKGGQHPPECQSNPANQATFTTQKHSGSEGSACSGISRSQINQVKFGVFAILGEKLWSDTYPIARFYGGPAYSQGVDSFIEFKFDGDKVKVFFQLESPSHKVELRRMMRLLFFHDRIDLSTTYQGLNLEYEEIQELKKAKIKYLEDQRSKFSP